MSEKVELRLSDRPDGFGFYYGRARLGDVFANVNVLPPAPLWDGDIQMSEYKPDPKCWIIFVDGEEVARVKRREDLAAAMLPRLESS
ncbi:MAG TPA: hypothetical protein PKW21_15015 [Rhabdaerophilum sp.]|nr:hypothetical protein [Rhabdaerophilum sp.]